MLFALFDSYLDQNFVYGVWFVGFSILISSLILAWAIKSRQP